MEHTFTWLIENYSYLSDKNGEAISSPEFFPNGQEISVWHLLLYPRGRDNRNKGYVSLALRRSFNDFGPEDVSLIYTLSFLRADGSSLISKGDQNIFQAGDSFSTNMLQMHELFQQMAAFLPQDVLTVRCTMWINEMDVHKVGQGFARSRIGVQHISFIHVVEGFSTLRCNEKRTFKIRTHLESLDSSMHLADSPCCNGKIILEITPSNKEIILLKYNLFFLGESGIVMKCGEEDNRFDDTREDFKKLPLHLTRNDILKRKSELLPDDKLTLMCECSFSTGLEYEVIEKSLFEIPSWALNEINNGRFNVAEKLFACPSALDDIKKLYSSQLLTDVEIETETKSYPTHRSLLCARSPVFKAMFTNDMKEKITGCIQVVDLENDTVEKLLHFLHSDYLRNITWDSAIKLYYAADKYVIEKLKLTCSSFFIYGLNTSNAIELLLLADTHSDSCLHGAVVDFILKHEEEVFPSEEWKEFIKTHPVLTRKTIMQKYVGKN